VRRIALTCLAAAACSRRAERVEAPAGAIVIHAETGGLSPADADATIARPIAVEVARLDGIAHVATESDAGEVRVTATLAPGAAFEPSAIAIDDAVRALTRSVPAAPEIEPRRRGPTIRAIARSDQFDGTALRTWVDWDLRRAILSTPGVAAADVCGGAIDEVVVAIDPARLDAFGSSVDPIVDAIGAAHGLPSAAATASDRFVLLAAGDESLDALRAVSIPTAAGARVTLGDLATIAERGRPDPCEPPAMDGAVIADVLLRPDADASAVAAAIRTAARAAPRGVIIQLAPAPARFVVALAADPGVDLRALASAWRGALAVAPGVLAIDRAPAVADAFTIDRGAAARAGIDDRALARSIEAATGGVIASTIYEVDHRLDVRVTIAGADLDAVRVPAAAGAVPLGSIAVRRLDDARIDAADGSPARIMTFELAAGDDADAAAGAAIAVARAAAPPPGGVRVIVWREP
jgi:multidrug efflux pump subunit AcrB